MQIEPILGSRAKYRQLAHRLSAAIRSGEFGEGSFLPSESELSSATGVSRVTVRSAIALLVRQGLVTRHQGRRTQVVGGAFAGQTHALLGLTYRNRLGLTHPYYAGVIRGINFALGDGDIDIEMINVNPAALARSAMSPDELLKDCDGLFLLFPWLDASEIEAVVDGGKPVVSIGVHPDGVDIPQVFADERVGFRAVIEHLLDLGHRKIGAVGTSLVSYPLRQGCHRTLYLVEELQRFAAEGRLETSGQWIQEVAEFTRECGVEAGTEIFAADGERPTAIIATEDSLASGVIDAARRVGLETPADLSVTGIGNYFDTDEIRVTSLAYPTFEMGVLAGEAMLGELQGKPQRGLAPFSLDLTVHETTAKARRPVDLVRLRSYYDEKRSPPVAMGAPLIQARRDTEGGGHLGEPIRVKS